MTEGGRMSETMCTGQQQCSCQNLNDDEVRKRQVMGYGSLLFAFALVGLSKLHESSEWLAVGSAFAFFLGYLNLGQARTRTCVVLAFAEKDKTGAQTQPVSDRATSRRLKKRSAKIILGSAALAIVTAALCWKV